jgi:hypothetical protein
MTSEMDFQTNEQAARHSIQLLKEIILAQDPAVNEVMAEVLEFTHSFLFEEDGEYIYGLTMTVDSVVFHSPLLGGDTPVNPKLTEFIQDNFAQSTWEDDSLEFNLEDLPSSSDDQDRNSFFERFGYFIGLIATLRS